MEHTGSVCVMGVGSECLGIMENVKKTELGICMLKTGDSIQNPNKSHNILSKGIK